MHYLMLLVLLLIHKPLYAQVHILTDQEIKQRVVEESVGLYLSLYGTESCPCPGYQRPDGQPCNISAWQLPVRDRPICYTTEVTPQMVQAYRTRSEPGYPRSSGIASQLVSHHPLSSMATTSGIDTAKNSFVFNGVLFHPLAQEGCNQITIGTPLTIAFQTYGSSRRYSSNVVVFRLPNGSQCPALSLGATNF